MQRGEEFTGFLKRIFHFGGEKETGEGEVGGVAAGGGFVEGTVELEAVVEDECCEEGSYWALHTCC